MANHFEGAYEVVKTQECIEQFSEIRKKFPRSSGLHDAIIWALERYPHGFDCIQKDFYHWITDELASPDYPVVKILFKIIPQKSQVVILSIVEL